MKRYVYALVAIAGMFAGGCATVSQEGGVSVSLVGIRPVQTSLFETTAEVTLRFTNESSRALSLAGSTHRLFVNGANIGRAGFQAVRV